MPQKLQLAPSRHGCTILCRTSHPSADSQAQDRISIDRWGIYILYIQTIRFRLHWRSNILYIQTIQMRLHWSIHRTSVHSYNSVVAPLHLKHFCTFNQLLISMRYRTIHSTMIGITYTRSSLEDVYVANLWCTQLTIIFRFSSTSNQEGASEI